ncbi:hypothetical protein [Haloarcula sp. H-GB5]
MAGLNAGSGGGFNYIQAAEPADPENAELWFDTDGGTDGQGEVKVYDGTEWDTTGYVSHDQLTNVSPGDHFTPGSGLSFAGGTLELLLSQYLTIDGNGNLGVASGSLGQDRLAFDTATQSELNGHTGDTSNPHSVDHGQLSGVGSADHHSRYSDGEAQTAAGSKAAENTVNMSGYGTHSFSNPVSSSDAHHFQAAAWVDNGGRYTLHSFFWTGGGWDGYDVKSSDLSWTTTNGGDTIELYNGNSQDLTAMYTIWVPR